VEAVKKAQKELYNDLRKIEKETQVIQDQIDQVKALGQSAEEQEEKLENLKLLLKAARQRIEDLWQYSRPYGHA